jgi:fructokinase
MNRKPVVVGIGELLWDVFPHGPQLGGAPGNFAMHVAKLGGEAHLISAVGKDELGQRAIQLLERRGVDCEGVAVQDDCPTGRVDITLDAEGQATFKFAKQIPWDHLVWTEVMGKLATQADAICFGTLGQRTAQSHETTMRFVDACRPGIRKIFDANLRPDSYSPEVIKTCLAASNAMKLNEEELPEIASMLNLPGGSEEELVRELADRYELNLIALTRGSRGSLLFHDDQVFEGSTKPVEVIDTVGAGDSFTATLLMGFFAGIEPAKLNQLANEVAAYVCSQPGATPELPDELLQAFTNGEHQFQS